MFSHNFFYKMPFILYCLFFIFFANQSFAKSLDITSIAKQVVIYDHQADQILFEKEIGKWGGQFICKELEARGHGPESCS